jgi:lipoprotein-anchoring transpeptidase ErfK/SrfK
MKLKKINGQVSDSADIKMVILLLVVIFSIFLFSDNGIKKYFKQTATPYVQKVSNVIQNVSPNSTTTGSVITPELIATSSTTNTLPIIAKVTERKGSYIEVTDGCGPYFGGACLSVRSGPGTEFEKIGSLRTGMVLKIAGTVKTASSTWYKIGFDEWVRYPERMKGDWYINADYVRVVSAESASKTAGIVENIDKKIIVDRSEQMVYAYEGDVLFMKQSVSTGKEGNLTPRGNFTISRKVPSRYMQGPLPGISEQEYDLPGVPWTMYFNEYGAALHGAYWHDKFGQQWSHGCVNLPVDKAEKLYEWADIGTAVVVRD